MKPPAELERICKGLAALDAMMSEDWESRYYSFDAAWSQGQRMAEMRNGSGDQRFIVFTPKGVFFKAFWHEHEHEKVEVIYKGLPTALAPQLEEVAFSLKDLTYGGWYDGAWTLRGNAKPMKEDLEILSGDPEAYQRYAEEYFERELPLAAIAHVLAGKKLTPKIVAQLSEERSLAELTSDLAEIGY